MTRAPSILQNFRHSCLSVALSLLVWKTGTIGDNARLQSQSTADHNMFYPGNRLLRFWLPAGLAVARFLRSTACTLLSGHPYLLGQPICLPMQGTEAEQCVRRKVI